MLVFEKTYSYSRDYYLNRSVIRFYLFPQTCRIEIFLEFRKVFVIFIIPDTSFTIDLHSVVIDRIVRPLNLPHHNLIDNYTTIPPAGVESAV